MTAYILPFEKMHGLGNDFVMVERRHLPSGVDDVKLTKILCNRNFGIGADGLIIVDLSSDRKSDFVWNYYNSDGSFAEMCGNGMRCFAKYVFERGFTDERTFSVSTKAGIIKPTIEDDATVTVDMGKAKLPEKIVDEIIIDSRTFKFTYIETGNPHCVIFLDKEITDVEFNKYGPLIEKHSKFPKGVNVEFVKVVSNSEVNCRVWERGCGPTLACGTGACAVVVAGQINGYLIEKAKVNLPGGSLNVRWDKNLNNIYLNGSATFVYTGNFVMDPVSVCKQISSV